MFGAAALLVLLGCLLPNAWLPPLPNDKLLHFAAFGGLGGLAARIAASPAHLMLWLLALLAGSWLIECLQQLVPDRGFSWQDLAANAAGLATAALLAPWLRATPAAFCTICP